MGTATSLGILTAGSISRILEQCTTLHSANSPPTTKDTPSRAEREPTAQNMRLGDPAILHKETTLDLFF